MCDRWAALYAVTYGLKVPKCIAKYSAPRQPISGASKECICLYSGVLRIRRWVVAIIEVLVGTVPCQKFETRSHIFLVGSGFKLLT